jgi:hypothetical protein
MRLREMVVPDLMNRKHTSPRQETTVRVALNFDTFAHDLST